MESNNQATHDRARAVVLKQLAPIEHSMALEDQRVDLTEGQVEDMIRDLGPRKQLISYTNRHLLWRIGYKLVVSMV